MYERNTPDDHVPLCADLPQEPDNTPLVVHAVSDAHPAFESVIFIRGIWIAREFELERVAMPYMPRQPRVDVRLENGRKRSSGSLVSRAGRQE
jgi:hypothetical protein